MVYCDSRILVSSKSMRLGWTGNNILVVLFLSKKFIDPSFTKPFGIHTLYEGMGELAGHSATSKTVALINLKFCKVLETTLKVLEMLNLLT